MAGVQNGMTTSIVADVVGPERTIGAVRRDSDGQQAAAEQVGEACAAVEVDVPELLQRSNDLGDPARLISWRP
jgi:hypothetical protein